MKDKWKWLIVGFMVWMTFVFAGIPLAKEIMEMIKGGL